MRPGVAFLASQSHYAAHLAPIWHALAPEDCAGWWAPLEARQEAERQGVERWQFRAGLPPRELLTVTASAGDSIAVAPGRAVLVEHGAGQVYDQENPSYSGGSQRGNVVLFLCPNEVSAGRNHRAYPDAGTEVVGSPRLDALIARPRDLSLGVVALSHHWDCNLTPEARWAQPHFLPAYPEIAARFDVLGHGHPRYRAVFRNLWRRLGIDYVERFDDLVEQAWLYVCDNSSTMYEWAALGRPVVVLNAPWYRRDVDLWPRFWACADVGIQVAEPDALAGAIERAMADPAEVAERRRAVVDEVFPLRDGLAAERAAHAITETLRSLRFAA